MSEPNRFQDQNLRLSDFQKEVWVVCPKCAKKAIAMVNFETQIARLFCDTCGYNKEKSTISSVFGQTFTIEMAAHSYFNAILWLQFPFKQDLFFAYSMLHLNYLEKYISATIREHKDRSHFTLIEKLPKFYHEAKNRETLLKIIAKLKAKDS